MGLDVYLYRYDGKTPREAEALEDALEARLDTELPYLDHNASTEAQRQTRYGEREARRKELGPEFECGAGEYGGWNGKHAVSVDDAVYPQHYFKIGYMRSSYNDGGIDRLAHNYFGVAGLYWIFDRSRDEDYCFQPDWAAARARALDLAARFRARQPKVSVMFQGLNPFSAPDKYPTDAHDALQRWLKTYEVEKSRPVVESDDGYRWFSNGDGFFCLRPAMRVLGAIEGIGPLKSPGVYLIYEQDQGESGEGGDEWYARACEITARTCDHVLQSGEPEKFWLHWSS